MAADSWSALWAAVSAVAALSSAGFALFIHARHVKITLFEKRFEVYEAAMRLIVASLQGEPAKHGDVTDYIRTTRAAEFLFDKATMIRLDELYIAHIRFRSKYVIWDKTADEHPEKTRRFDEQVEARARLEAHLDPLKECFRRYLDLTSIAPDLT
jgi:hypothetical protein